MITSDWHQHSHHSIECHGNGKTITKLIEDTEARGVTDFGVTDHIHTPVNRPDLEASSREFWSESRSERVHFGVEVSVVSQWEIDRIASDKVGSPSYGIREGGPPGGPLALGIEANDLKELRIEYVIGAVHWTMYVPLELETFIHDYYRQIMFLAAHPLVTIIAHPWWVMGWKDDSGKNYPPWVVGDFRMIPKSFHDEFAAAVLEHGKVVEINGECSLAHPDYPEKFKQQYAELLAGWKERGVTLSYGSDHHGPPWRLADAEEVERRLNAVGITDADLWRLPPRTSASPSL